jgi:hypothetical protein
MTPEEAKAASHEFLVRHGIQVNDFLPQIESPSDLRARSAEEIARRCMVLCHVIGIGFGGDSRQLKAALEEFDLWQYASPTEQDLLNRTEHTDQEKIDAIWLTECVQSLAWCLGLVELDHFRQSDDELASNFPEPFTDPRNFIAESTKRPFNEIYQQLDLHYRLHWAARNARLKGTPCPVSEEWIEERRKGLEWAINADTEWDEVPLST